MFKDFTHFLSDNMKSVTNDEIVVSTLLFPLYPILNQHRAHGRSGINIYVL